ncbi:hypothetical protein Tco_0445264 [Tanacetum coccineum]
MKTSETLNPTKSTMPLLQELNLQKRKQVSRRSKLADKTTTPPKGKRLKTSAKTAKPAKTSMDKGLTMLSEVALTEAEQLKLVIEMSKTQTHSSHASCSGVDEGTGAIPGVPDVPTYNSNDEQISWKYSNEEDNDEVSLNDDDDDDDANNQDDDNQDDVDQEHDDQDDDANEDAQDKDDQDDENQDDDNEQTDSDNNGVDFVHPKFLTHDEEESFNPRVQTPSHVESIDDEEVQGVNIEGEEIDEETNSKESEGNEFYRDMNINLEGRDVEMTDAQPTNVQTTQVTEDTHVIIPPVIPEGQQQSSYVSSGFILNMLNPNQNTGIDSLFTESPSLVDVLVITIAEPPLLSTKTLPPPPTPLITHMQQTLFKQTNHFAEVVSSIPGIVDAYLANKMHEAVKTDVQLQSERLRDKAQAENANFLNKLDDNIKKIIKDQVKEQVKAQVSKILPKIEKTINKKLKAEVMTRSSTESKTSLAIAANLSELELKKILIEKMKSNKSIHRSDEQKNLYKALVDAYESDKLIINTYGDTVSFKRRRDDEDKDKEHFAGLNRGSKRRQARKEPKESARDVYSKRRIIAVIKLQIVKWHGYKHLDWITVRKLTNLNVEDHLAFGVSLRMFTRSIVIQRHVEDLQLGVESSQKKLNITKPDTYRSDLKRKDAYTTYSNPRGFIYQNKDKKNKLLRIDELHKFSDGTLDDVRTVLNDRLKGIRMEYLPQTIWRQSDRERAKAMIQAIDKQLKSRRIMRSLEIFVGGRPHRYSNPMIQPELEGSTQGYPLVSVEVLRYDTKGEKLVDIEKVAVCSSLLRVLRIILVILPEHPSDIIHSEDGNPA